MDIEPQATAACEYAEMGYRVFPTHGLTPSGNCTCQGKMPECPRGSPGKHPRIIEWPDRATTDTRQILEWWLRFPRSNVAITTENLLVADFDGSEGEDLARTYGVLDDEDVPLSRTGRGVQASHGPPVRPVRSTAGVMPGLDIRARGGYVVAPPSRHVVGRQYAWIRRLPEPSRLPAPCAWYPLERDKRRNQNHNRQQRPWGTASRSRELLAYSCAQMRLRREGDRNAFLFREACHFAGMVREGTLSAVELIAGLYEAASAAGLPGDEIDCTLSSALRREGVDDL